MSARAARLAAMKNVQEDVLRGIARKRKFMKNYSVVRALVNNPSILLADEPTGNLDTASSNEVFALLRRIHEEVGTSFLVVTHDPRLAGRCDRVIELVDGRIDRDGPPQPVH